MPGQEAGSDVKSADSRTIKIEGSFKAALEMLEHSGKNLFITGKAGTGKSTLLQHFISTTTKRVAVLAPTGVAALNVKGQTIHSFFHFGPDITVDTVKKLRGGRGSMYKSLDMIVIDEISMVRADLLDCIDAFMRLNGRSNSTRFGGTQMVFIGDLYQLPPIVSGAEAQMFKERYKSPYFFDAHAFRGFPAEFVELEKYYRHQDLKFIELLNSVRNNTATEEQIDALNRRFDPSFVPGLYDGYITLVTTNELADEINGANLDRLGGVVHTYNAVLEGGFGRNSLPADEELKVKEGAQVMLLNNDKQGRWVNGSIGRIISINDGKQQDTIMVRLSDGSEVGVTRHTWELFRFAYDAKTSSLSHEVVGSFIQYPLMLAWAVTIHKSQGKTFDRMVLDIGRGTFANGQLYVALSRCRTLGGIVLKRRLEKRHIWTDWRVVRFLTRYQYDRSDSLMPLEKKMEIIRTAIRNKGKLDILYLKANDEKSRRIVAPSRVGKFEYNGSSYLGMEGFDSKRNDYRNFRIDRILEMKDA